MRSQKGVTLIELMIAVVILVIVLVGVFALLINQTKTSYVESSKSKSIQTGIVADSVIIRDVAMAGLGIPTEYGTPPQFTPVGIDDNTGPNGSDQLSLKGAAISSGVSDYMKWGYNTAYIHNGDSTIYLTSREEFGTSSNYPNEFTKNGHNHPFETEDGVVFLDAETMELKDAYIHKVTSCDSDSITVSPPAGFVATEKGILIFSLGGISSSTFSDYLSTFTGYRLGTSNSVQSCAPNTYPLLRVYGSSMPVMDCVLDFQAQYGYPDSNGVTWQDTITPGKNPQMIRIYIVAQQGKRDSRYTYPSTSITTANNTINLDSNQLHYHWRTIKLDIPLREVK